MKITSALFRASAPQYEDCPNSYLPEFAFVGRSNVGKSSLINMLTSTRELAKTSSVPGKTQMINFFEINHSWNLVDLPGYGYAKLSKSRQHEFNVHVSAYLTGRPNLKNVFALIDSRLEPLDGDLAFVHWLHQCEIPFSIVFTKTDKASDQTTQNHSAQFLNELHEHGIHPKKHFSCSAKTNRGRGEILSFIEHFLPNKKKKGKRTKVSLNWMNKH